MSRWGLCLGIVSGIVMLLSARAGAANESSIILHSPRELQVVQRHSVTSGKVLVSGKVEGNADNVEVRFSGKAADGKDLPDRWESIAYKPVSKSFFGKVPVAAGGWYKVEVRATSGGQPVGQPVTLSKVGVGEVFVAAGQSNSTNCGEFKTTQTSGMVSSFGGTSWQIADDPQIGVHDKTQGGSPWPAFGDAMYAKYNVPIGIAATGHGGTSVWQWDPQLGEGSLFMWMMHRVHQLGPGGFRAILWHQGESDVAMSTEDYVQKMSTLIAESKKEAGWEFPWFVAQVSYHSPENPKHDTTRDAHKKLWDTGVALEGPDTDTLAGDNRDMNGKGIHFSPKGLKAHGQMWAEKVGAYLHKALAADEKPVH